MRTRRGKRSGRRSAWFWCCLAVAGWVAGADAQESQPARARGRVRPHIVFFLTDDMRFDAMGCAGNPIIHTPNLDRLASQGTLFRNCFCTTSICSVSRASFLTGQYGSRHGIEDFKTPLSRQALARTFPALLRAAGYYTGFVGKWGLGGELPKEAFDFFTGFSGQGRYFEPGDPEHITRKLTRQVLQFLDERPHGRPLLLCVSFKAPHCQDGAKQQFQPDPAYASLYRDVTIPEPVTATPEAFAALPAFLQQSEGRRRWERRFATPSMFQENVKNYYRLITGVDAAVGAVMDRLKQAGLDRRTVVIFTSDNGFFLGEHGLAGKWFMYEESIRLPLIIRDPGVPPIARGRRVDAMALNIDIAPTIVDLAGLPVPSVMQGRSLRPWVAGRFPAWRTEFFYEHHYDHHGRIPPCEGVRTERYTYIRYLTTDPVQEALFDLDTDPHQLHDRAGDAAYRPVLEQLRRRWKRWRQAVR